MVASWSPKNAPAALDVTQIVAQTVTKPVKNFGISFEGEKKDCLVSLAVPHCPRSWTHPGSNLCYFVVGQVVWLSARRTSQNRASTYKLLTANSSATSHRCSQKMLKAKNKVISTFGRRVHHPKCVYIYMCVCVCVVFVFICVLVMHISCTVLV